VSKLAGLAAAALGVVACSSSTSNAPQQESASSPTEAPPPPPRVCRTGPSTSHAWFTEVTDEVGLAQTDAFQPAGTTVVSADLDGDGWPDLIFMRGDSTRGLVKGKRVRFLMMNRPDPQDPTGKKRVFVDVPDQAGLLATRDGQGDRGASIALLGDLDGDGAVDVITCPSDFTTNADIKDGCVAFLNDGKGHFSIAPESDIDAKPYPVTSALLFDYDRDGILDFWPAGMAHWGYGPPGSNWTLGPRLFRGNGDGTFTNVTAEVGLPARDGDPQNGTSFRRTFGVTACDLYGDGNLSVITASYGREENQVWRNVNGRFTNVAHELGLDHDDREDYSDDQSYRCYCSLKKDCDPMPPAPNMPCNAFGGPYLRGWFPGETDQPYMLGGNNFGVACADVNDDGNMDVLFATVVHADVGSSSDPTEIALNPGGGRKFVRPGNEKTGLARPTVGNNWNFGDNMPVFADIDLDGRKDLYLTSTVYPGSRPWLWHQKADGTFEEIGLEAGITKKTGVNTFSPITQGVALIDYDGDGDLDLVVGSVDGTNQVRVFRNDVGQDSNFVRVRLVGKGAGHSNTSAIGARVRVTAGGRTQTLEVHGGQGIGNIQNDFVLTFGLGVVCDIDEIEVRWPDAANTVTTYENVRANYTVTITEGGGLTYR
jgi:hypothetical protein